MASTVRVTLQNPNDHGDTLAYHIVPDDHALAQDWLVALREILNQGLELEKTFCFLGWPNSHRSIDVLCQELNHSIEIINNHDFTQHGLNDYVIEEWFSEHTVRFPDSYPVETRTPDSGHSDRREALGLKLKHGIMNQLHNHFEVLEGTVEQPSPYGQASPPEVRHAIRQLNNICHEMESLVLSQRKQRVAPEWIRPSQITTFLDATRYHLTDQHRQGFRTNGYDRQFGHVYMHWSQIGKTLFEVFRDEGAPDLTDTVCEAITHLQYYSGEFDVEWGRDVVRNHDCPWHDQQQLMFEDWLIRNGRDPEDPQLSLGYLHIGEIDLTRSFGTTDRFKIWDMVGHHLDIARIDVL